MNPFTMAWQAIISFSLVDTVAQVKEAFANLNFIRWYDLYNMTWEEIIAMASQNGDFAATTFGQYCAQYAATMTNWVYTLAALCAIVILLCKKNKKWYWYMFFSLVAVMSVTSVGMHTADYGEFTPGVITTKLLASYVDMSFTELMAWSGVICFAFEFYGDDIAKRNKIAIGTSVWAGIVLLWLTFEVFVQKNRPLWIGGRDESGMPYDMGGDKGGLSLAELGCFLTCIAFSIYSSTSLEQFLKTSLVLFFSFLQPSFQHLLSLHSGETMKSIPSPSVTSTDTPSGICSPLSVHLKLSSGSTPERITS